MYSVKQLVSLFTDHFRKDEESNTHKLMQLFSDELQLLEETNNRIIEWRNIDKAEGKALDLIGQNVVQPRGTTNDERYRIMLKTKIARNLADGTINGLIKAMAYALQLDMSEIEITELWELLDEPAAIGLEALPPEKIKDAGFTQEQFYQLLKTLIAAGVRLRLIRTIKTEPIHVGVKSYSFGVQYPICNTFETAEMLGKMASMRANTKTKAYVFTPNVPICNNFTTAKIINIKSEHDIEVETDSRTVNVVYARAGETYTKESENE